MARIDQLFEMMIKSDASDLHLSAGHAPYLRIHGEMKRIEMDPLSNEDCQALVFEILSEKQKRNFVENWELDCSYAVENLGRFRCNVFMQRLGLGAVFRVIPEKIKTVEQLGLPASLLDLVNVHKGLICVTGPTGSGKSTTLAALVDYINRNERTHIVTIEDPIEFVHKSQKSLVNQREVHGHTKSFANALKASLREDPDIILVGEMRDLETIQLALTAAETGHLVFGTLHTNSAHKTIDRIIDVFPETKQAQIRVMLSESLRGVIAQSLLPKKGGGRVAVLEVLLNTRAVANLIREGKTFQIPSSMQTGKNQGMITFDASVEEAVEKGLVDTKDAMEFLGKLSAKDDGGGPARSPAASTVTPMTNPKPGPSTATASNPTAPSAAGLFGRIKKPGT